MSYNRGYVFTDKRKKNIIKLNSKPKNAEWKKKISIAHKGLKPSKKTKIKMSVSRRKRTDLSGDKSHFWKGGITTHKRKIYLNSRRRARKMNADGSYTQEEWEDLKKKHNYTCLACSKKEPEIKLTEDHIIPLSKGGIDNIDNIQPLCKSCNSKKYTKIIKY